ncbi:BPSS1780 family membrane protein [Thiobacillus denitrificans]|uniref:Transmembrane protein n=1 Tax=Thiobacillus denitrificans TaxID=36861 RepID=A0A106BQI1_THIDE|nr:BPSS1780 family membrane protein [Thiobacillus denitrificans]KVW96791.1 transmembrane protein [Thiobacillus denitrificans]
MNTASNQDIPRKVAASQGFQWVAAGFRLYRKNPLLLSAAFGVLFGVVMALGLIPIVGGSLSELASPLMVAGFMAAYRMLDDGGELELPNFLAGVRGPAIPLMAVGAVQLLGTLLIGKIMLGMGFDPQAIMTAAQSQKDPAEMQALLNEALPAVFTGLLLFTPLIMATWFAPALILFGGARPVTALGVSLKAVARNWAAMMVNGLTLGLLLILAALVPMLLGLLVAMPVLFGSLYASYQAIFAVWADESAAAPDNVVSL